MAPNNGAKQNFDLDDWTRAAGAGLQQQNDEDDVSPVNAGRQRYCVDCGQAIPDGAKFCPSCGREQ